MRIFKGGHFKSPAGIKFPSTLTCDCIDKHHMIQIDNTRKTWEDYVKTEAEP